MAEEDFSLPVLPVGESWKLPFGLIFGRLSMNAKPYFKSPFSFVISTSPKEIELVGASAHYLTSSIPPAGPIQASRGAVQLARDKDVWWLLVKCQFEDSSKKRSSEVNELVAFRVQLDLDPPTMSTVEYNRRLLEESQVVSYLLRLENREVPYWLLNAGGNFQGSSRRGSVKVKSFEDAMAKNVARRSLPVASTINLASDEVPIPSCESRTWKLASGEIYGTAFLENDGFSGTCFQFVIQESADQATLRCISAYYWTDSLPPYGSLRETQGVARLGRDEDRYWLLVDCTLQNSSIGVHRGEWKIEETLVIPVDVAPGQISDSEYSRKLTEQAKIVSILLQSEGFDELDPVPSKAE